MKQFQIMHFTYLRGKSEKKPEDKNVFTVVCSLSHIDCSHFQLIEAHCGAECSDYGLLERQAECSQVLIRASKEERILRWSFLASFPHA